MISAEQIKQFAVEYANANAGNDNVGEGVEAFLAGAAFVAARHEGEIERLREALQKMVEPLPLDKNPKMTVSEAFDEFAKRIGIGVQALAPQPLAQEKDL